METSKGDEPMSKHLETLIARSAEPRSTAGVPLPDAEIVRIDALCAKLGVRRRDWLAAVVLDALEVEGPAQ